MNNKNTNSHSLSNKNNNQIVSTNAANSNEGFEQMSIPNGGAENKALIDAQKRANK